MGGSLKEREEKSCQFQFIKSSEPEMQYWKLSLHYIPIFESLGFLKAALLQHES